MKYLIKSAEIFNADFHFTYQKPSVCPFCGCGTDATFKNKTNYTFNEGRILLASCECTSCHKSFFFACEQSNQGLAKNVCLYPSEVVTPYSNDNLSAISERFIDMYNQALTAERNGHLELSAIGYRSALEILVKDYAIHELGQPRDSVTKCSLFNAIAEYLNQESLVNTADVVRILGNDYTHYERKYPEHDFALLKKYMEIFLSQIEALYMIKHPPVSRRQ